MKLKYIVIKIKEIRKATTINYNNNKRHMSVSQMLCSHKYTE